MCFLFLSEDNQKDVGSYYYTAYITLKDGRRIYAKDYGLKAFRILVNK